MLIPKNPNKILRKLIRKRKLKVYLARHKEWFEGRVTNIHIPWMYRTYTEDISLTYVVHVGKYESTYSTHIRDIIKYYGKKYKI